MRDICPQVQSRRAPLNGHYSVSTAHTVPCGPHGGAGFLFINDLTNKATGVVLVVLIVLYVGTQLVSSLMMASPTMDHDPAAADHAACRCSSCSSSSTSRPA